MKKIILLVSILCSSLAFSQIDVSPAQQPQKKWRIGGNIGLSFGNNDYFGLSISPTLGYEITRNLEGGISLGYRYSKRRHSKQHMFNGGPYLNFSPINSLFLRTQYAYYTGSTEYTDISRTRHFNENALWVGGGYRSGGRVKVYAGLMYNVLYKEGQSIFANGLRPIAGVSIRI